jgi:hypothetical protein
MDPVRSASAGRGRRIAVLDADESVCRSVVEIGEVVRPLDPKADGDEVAARILLEGAVRISGHASCEL